MKINKFFALAAIAIMAMGVMGFFSTRVHAQGVTTIAPVVQPQDCSLDQADETEVSSAADTDNIELQCGDQSGADTSAETIDAADTDNVNVEEQVGDQNASDTGVEAPEVEVLAVP